MGALSSKAASERLPSPSPWGFPLRVVIVGGGSSGLAVAQGIEASRALQVTVIEPNQYYEAKPANVAALFHPPPRAFGAHDGLVISMEKHTMPLEGLLPFSKIIHDRAVGVELHEKHEILKRGADGRLDALHSEAGAHDFTADMKRFVLRRFLKKTGLKPDSAALPGGSSTAAASHTGAAAAAAAAAAASTAASSPSDDAQAKLSALRKVQIDFEDSQSVLWILLEKFTIARARAADALTTRIARSTAEELLAKLTETASIRQYYHEQDYSENFDAHMLEYAQDVCNARWPAPASEESLQLVVQVLTMFAEAIQHTIHRLEELGVPLWGDELPAADLLQWAVVADQRQWNSTPAPRLSPESVARYHAPSASGHVTLASGGTVPFDVLILAPGSHRLHPFAASRAAPSVDARVHELSRTRERVLSAKSIMVVGGGPTGVEVAGEIKHRYPEKDVMLVHSRGSLLNNMDAKWGAAARTALEKLGVAVVLNQRVKQTLDAVDQKEAAAAGDDDQPAGAGAAAAAATVAATHRVSVVDSSYQTDTGRALDADLVFWAATPEPNTAWLRGTAVNDAVGDDGRVQVDAFLRCRLPDHDGDGHAPLIFCVGDANDVAEPETNQQFDTLMSGLDHAKLVADNLLRYVASKPLRGYTGASYKTRLISVGREDGVGTQYGVLFTGPRVPQLQARAYESHLVDVGETGLQHRALRRSVVKRLHVHGHGDRLRQAVEEDEAAARGLSTPEVVVGGAGTV